MLFAITTTGKVVLLGVAGTFMAFAILTAIVVPRRFPEFPGRRLGVYLAVVALFFAAQMGAVLWVAETQETEEAAAAETEAGSTEPGTTEPGATEPAETETTPAGTETQPTETEPAGTGGAAAGEEVFASAGCGSCHTLSAAGSSGTIGPNLDEARPSVDKVVERVTNGQGAMPSFRDQLSEQQIRDVAAYVSGSTRGS